MRVYGITSEYNHSTYMSNYIVVTPVKDEERFIEQTMASMVAQTKLPATWVVVDDGSTDRTPAIIDRFASEHRFIQLLRREKRSARHTGVAEVHAFYAGLEVAKRVEHDYIVKLDGDLSFEPNYFADLIAEFERRPRLGIASGVYLEKRRGEWQMIVMPSYHSAGASKVVRRECFEDISGFIPERGWDTVDEIRAWGKGWETTHFPNLKMKHLKAEGSGMGLLYTETMHGEIFYRTGGGAAFFLLKVAARFLRRPIFTGGLFMLWGFVRASFVRRDHLVSAKESRIYRRLLWQRLRSKVKASA